MELRRHHVRGGHLVALDQLEHPFGVPLVHENDRVAEMHRCTAEAHDGRVVEGRPDDVHVPVVGLDAEQEEDSAEPERRLLGRDPGQARASRPSAGPSCPRCSS